MIIPNIYDKNELNEAIERLTILRKKAKASDSRKIYLRILTYRQFIEDIEKKEILKEKLEQEWLDDVIAQEVQ